jgi:uncharacterized membrane protein YbhN (UPF0104 family)
VSKPARRIKPLILSIAATAVLLILAFGFVDLKSVWGVLARMSPAMAIVVLAITGTYNVALFSDRWRRMLAYLGYEHSLDEVLLVNYGLGPIHLVMPVQTGEAVSAVALSRKSGGPLAVYLGTLAYGKYLNLIATVIILFAGLATTQRLPLPGLSRVILLFAAITVTATALEFAFVRAPIQKLLSRFGEKSAEAVRDLFAVYAEISLGKKIFLLAYSLVYQTAEVFVCYLLFSMLGLHVPMAELMTIVALVILVSSVPITIAGAGTREALCLLLLAGYADAETAVAAGLAYTFVEYVWPLIVGAPLTRSVISEYLLDKPDQ